MEGKARVGTKRVLVEAALGLALAVALGSSPVAEARAPSGNGSASPYSAALLMDASTGRILFEHNARDRRPPASMTKMMVMLIVAERVRAGDLAWSDTVRTSRWASKMGGSQVYLREGEEFTLEEMMQAVVIHSGNDAAVAVAEAVAGTVPAFVELMNLRARELGLEDTEFHSPHGLPPGRGQEADVSSARDLAVLGREIVAHPRLMEWAGTRSAPFRGGEFQLTNTNKLVHRTSWVDGLKTGYFRAAGFNVAATAERNGLRLIAVVLGAQRKEDCFGQAAALLTSGFARYTTVVAVRKGDVIASDVPVRAGIPSFVRVVAGDAVEVLADKSENPEFTLELAVPALLEAPLHTDSRVGEVIVRDGGEEIGRVPALAAEDVERQKSLWERFF